MEEAISNYFMDFIMTTLGTAVFALIGFVWKVSHRVSSLEKTLEGETKVRQMSEKEIRRDIDVIYSSVDKNREWTTNRMMSIAKEMK